MTTIADIVAAIVSALSADLGTYDLSATGAVREGTYSSPPSVGAFACVCPPRQRGSEWACAEFERETYAIEIRLWAPYTDETPEAHAAAERAIVAEAKAALMAARYSNTALFRCLSFQATEGDPDPVVVDASPGWASHRLTIETVHNRATGVSPS